MELANLRNLKKRRKESLVSAADVERVRRQRRAAHTEEEHAQVREHVRDLASNLRSKPQNNPQLLRMSGIAAIIIGLIMGAIIFYAAGLL